MSKFIELTYKGSRKHVLVNIDDIARISDAEGGGTMLWERSNPGDYIHVVETYAQIWHCLNMSDGIVQLEDI